MRKYVVLYLFILISGILNAQRYTSEKGHITFFSDATIEDIEAENTIVGSLFNATSGEVVYIIKIRDFVFDKALMREHFNEKYMESEKYPKATFQGRVVGFKPDIIGAQKVRAVGKLSMHGVVRDIDVPGSAENVNGKIHMKSKFIMKLEDYNIKIPTLVWQNIAEQIEVSVDFIYKPA
ncbi:YceI family protein [Chryseosolibacter indicus]|uniref:YceI family protein n=1 Tax=Chryseosolibacter indicus TaxID=2782351 RepID=A0ABS5VQC9_9BACT|nr:YceI family protein [Chryseosolibacter indicus]MBT1703648.1 YceI family protein [Chryseosolibacter indicus]